MGRGRQKAKQTKIARKLKYLTTETDYDELAKELRGKEPGEGQQDPFTVVEEEYGHPSPNRKDGGERESAAGTKTTDDDLDEYARWAAEAAAKATSGEMPAVKPRKKIPIPVPSALKGRHAAPSPLAAVAASAKALTSKTAGAKTAGAKAGPAKSDGGKDEVTRSAVKKTAARTSAATPGAAKTTGGKAAAKKAAGKSTSAKAKKTGGAGRS